MLKFFSRMERTRNAVLLVFAILMVLSLVLFYAPTRNAVQGNLARDESTVAKVGSEYVTVADLAQQQEKMSQMGRAMPAKFFLDNMVRQRMIRGAAKSLGLTATDAEVAAYIRKTNKSDDGTPFDQKIYEQNVTEQFGSIQNYENSVRDQLSGQKVLAFVTSGVTVSDDEVLSEYQRKNTKFDLTYIPVSTADLAQAIKPTDEELKNYFDQNKASYHIDVPQKKIRYIFLDTSKIGEKLNISDEDLKAEYDKLPADKKQAGVEGQQIVLRIPKDQETQTFQKANELVAEARKDGGKISAEAFADLAKGHSEDAKSAANGGKLPGLVRENKNNPTDPYQQLLKMQPGDVSEPIKYQDRYFILRRGETVPKSFEDARKEIEVSLRNRRAYAVAAELAQKVTDRLKETKDVQKTAEEFAAQANMNPKDMVRETGFTKPGDTVENVGISPQFEQGIAGLENQSDVGDKIPVQNGFAVPMLVDKRDPRDAEFNEVKDRVAEAYKLDQARKQVEDVAKQIAQTATSAGNLSAAAQAKGLKTLDTKSFIVGSPLGQGPSATTSDALEDAIFNLKSGEVTKTPIKAGDNWYVVGVTNRTEADAADFAKQRDDLIEAKLTQKRGQVFSDYLAAKRREMESSGSIKIYKDALAKLDETPADADAEE